jgi:hypothetical protein
MSDHSFRGKPYVIDISKDSATNNGFGLATHPTSAAIHESTKSMHSIFQAIRQHVTGGVYTASAISVGIDTDYIGGPPTTTRQCFKPNTRDPSEHAHVNPTIVPKFGLAPTLDHVRRETCPYQCLQLVDPNRTASFGLKPSRRVENEHHLPAEVDHQ